MEQKKDGFSGQRAIALPRSIINKYCVHNPLISGAYITDIGYYPKARFHYRERPNGIDQHILIYNIEGEGWAEINNKKYKITAGDFFIAPAGKSNKYASGENKPWTIYWVHFKGPIADAFVDAFFKKNKSYQGSVSRMQERTNIFEQIYNSLERGYSRDKLTYVNMYLMQFLYSFLFVEDFEQTSTKPDDKDPVNRSIDFMQKNIHRMVDLKSIAESVNISASHYSFIFKNRTGFSPIEYFNQLKIQKACQYLQFTSMRIKEIALALGIEDPYYFSRAFTMLMGISPRSYRLKSNHK